MSQWFGVWSRPPDRPAQAALALAIALFAAALVPGGARWVAARSDLSSLTDLNRRRRFLAVASFVAAFLSLGYIAFYLGGGPRAQEASTYWLQGRALSHGLFAWSVPEPSATFRAQDLLFRPPGRLSGVFPPGYPLLLALGFLVGAPMLVGPLIAAALVVATWLLAHEVASDSGSTGAKPEAVARAAAGFSIVSAALRYYTADALPHGAAAVAVAAALACALRARRTGDPRLFGAAGLALGLLVALRPASAVAVGVVVTALAIGRARTLRGRRLAWLCVTALPGTLLLVAANRAATGHAFVSAQSAYLALAGHATPSPTTGTWRRFFDRGRMHLLDIANFEPLALLALVPLVTGTVRRDVASVVAVIFGEVAAQWAFRSSAPSAPSFSLVAVVPLEHVLMAVGLGRLRPRSFASAVMAVLALALAGFALHASYEHASLAASDLGRPRFEPDVARDANVTSGLLFFDDDNGYKLANDPDVSASHGLEAVRMRGDDHDRLLYDSLGHPPVHHYVATDAGSSVSPWTPLSAGSDTWRFEAESDWPPVATSGGWAEAVAAKSPCASGGRILRVTPELGHAEASATIALPMPPTPQGAASAERRAWLVVPRVLLEGGSGRGTLTLQAQPSAQPGETADGAAGAVTDAPHLADWEWNDTANFSGCVDLPGRMVELVGSSPRAWLLVRAKGGSVALDKTTLWPK